MTSIHNLSEKISTAPHLPMGRNIAEPLDAGRPQGGVGVKAAGDGVVDDGLLLFVEEGDELALGANGAVDAGVDVVEEVGDGVLFGERGEGDSTPPKSVSRYLREGSPICQALKFRFQISH